MIHTVKQGETLSRIANHYGLASASSLYDLAENSDFRQLRKNPNLIYPGDKVFIPQRQSAKFDLKINKKNTFVIKRVKETFRIRITLEDEENDQLANVKVSLLINEQEFKTTIQGDGMAEWKLPKSNQREAILKIFTDEKSNDPSHVYTIALGSLDPIEQDTGIQARLNALGFHCGNVDGNPGKKVQQAITEFQKENDMTVDGNAGPLTLDKLANLYGC